ncbi:hypothetical protein F4813DRAFT_397594 [Daldinia decipiens]|uniref:uncharacterized protein n=1 Tax=Daldinia decipiens TaxID=326647 RepID=UPI0020C56BAF|nr:uncharacterized protein F4813DRAFT_397594 [Daldinia decipiens]KAI1656426.1 hypothetical protein F4813DRAFT_397594 [Daldinia decipiens]
MCQQWLLKYKVCGHFDRDEELVYCEKFNSSFPERCLRSFGSDIIRPYTPGDGECYRCTGRKFLDAQWDRTISTDMDDTRLAFSLARERLFSFNFVTVMDLQKAQDLLTYTYLSQGVVMNVRNMLKIFGYEHPRLETEVDMDNQNSWRGETPFTPASEYMFQYAPPPTPNSAVLFGTVVSTPAEDPGAN